MTKGLSIRSAIWNITGILGVLLIMTILFRTLPSNAASRFASFSMPELTQTDQSAWLNSEPLTKAALEGKVVLIDFWTFECWNCYRSFPWLNALEAKFADNNFLVLGIHSPEFKHEHDREQVAEKIEEFGLRHPVMMDNDFAFWRAMKNQAWPTFYLVDAKGQVRFRFIGETHKGDRRALAVEAAVEALLEESGA